VKSGIFFEMSVPRTLQRGIEKRDFDHSADRTRA